jgi:flagellar motor protein MotB
MRNIATVVLLVVLVASIVSGVVLYQRYRDTKDALLMSEKKISELEVKIDKLTRETSSFRDQLRESTQKFKELKGTRERITVLEHAITLKDSTLSHFEETIRTLREDLKKEREAKKSLKAELTSRHASLAELWKRLRAAQSRNRSLEDEIAQRCTEIEGLHRKIAVLEEEITESNTKIKVLTRKLSALRGEKAVAVTKIDELKSAYESLISDLTEQIEHQEVTIKRFEEKISVTFIDHILFEFGKATITPDGEMILGKVGDTLKMVKRKKIRVLGHTDDRPIHPDYHYRFPSNWELSSARASAVVRYFQQVPGLDPGNLEAVGRSFYDPVASNRTPQGRAQNRRVEIIIAPQLE